VNLHWTEGAQDDLAEIVARLIDYSGEESALRRLRKIHKAVRLLAVTPKMGRQAEVPGVREIVIGGTPCIVGYRILPAEISDDIHIVGIRFANEQFPSGGSWNV
jgi:plasmid stabilization system protein ParE